MQNLSAKEKALDYYSQDCINCSQSVVGGHLDKFPTSAKETLKLAAGFGGGMRCGEVCGAVTGGIITLGALYGHSEGDDAEGKQRIGELVIELESRFKNQFGSLLCKDLLGGNLGIPEEAERIKEQNITKQRCPAFVGFAAEAVDKIIEENKL